MQGWIKIHRDIQNHWIWDKPEYLKWWLDIIISVNHKDKKTLINNEVFMCKRGQSLNSLNTWAKRFKTNKSKVRRFFKLLQNDNMICIENVKKTTQLTVCNYDSYQSERNDVETQTKRKRNASETQMTPNKNDKNDKNDKKEKNDKNILSKIENFDENVFNLYDKVIGYFDEPKNDKTKFNFLDTLDKLHRIDKYSFQEIETMIVGAKKDSFWDKQFLSINKLRSTDKNGVHYHKRFSKLFGQYKKPKERVGMKGLDIDAIMNGTLTLNKDGRYD